MYWRYCICTAAFLGAYAILELEVSQASTCPDLVAVGTAHSLAASAPGIMRPQSRGVFTVLVCNSFQKI